jgi:hypothetical protein
VFECRPLLSRHCPFHVPLCDTLHFSRQALVRNGDPMCQACLEETVSSKVGAAQASAVAGVRMQHVGSCGNHTHTRTHVHTPTALLRPQFRLAKGKGAFLTRERVVVAVSGGQSVPSWLAVVCCEHRHVPCCCLCKTAWIRFAKPHAACCAVGCVFSRLHKLIVHAQNT